jgi:lipid-A-disaccharide synthase
VRQIARDVARMLVILPFEAKFYAERGVPAVYVGNPLADSLRLPAGGSGFLQMADGPGGHSGAPTLSKGAEMRRTLGLDPRRPLLALLPGSRMQEIRRLWPIILGAARRLRERLPDLQLAVPVAPTLRRDLFGEAPEVTFFDGRAPEVLAAASAAVVTSGTATLEAALAQTPLCCVYRTSWINWILGRLVVRIRHLSLVNLIAGRTVIPEVLQSRCTPANVAAAALPLLTESPERAAQLDALRALREELAPPGSMGASRRAADEVRALLEAP